MTYEKLKATVSLWDSDLFGYRVGKLHVTGGAIPISYVQKANEDDFDVVFVSANGWYEEKKGMTALDWRYEMELTRPQKMMGEPAVLALEGPLPQHLHIAETAFTDSRFSRDSFLAQKVPELYRRWLMNRSGQLWALQGKQQEDGFLLTVLDPDDVPRISLIGVAVQYRNLGVGERLTVGVMENFPNAKAWRTTVLVRNWRALRFYEGLGFRVKGVSTAFHVWI